MLELRAFAFIVSSIGVIDWAMADMKRFPARPTFLNNIKLSLRTWQACYGRPIVTMVTMSGLVFRRQMYKPRHVPRPSLSIF
jgi:hypothetical protein